MPGSGTFCSAAVSARPAARAMRAGLLTLAALSCLAMSAPVAALQTNAPDAATQAAMERRTTARTNLSGALSRIAANASDMDALLDAGRASIQLEDFRAALSFLVRAQKLSPDNGPVHAALGSVMVRMERPQKALEYFSKAQLQGAPERTFLSDRALAYDLLGNQPAAQRDYQLALAQVSDPEITRRFALSLGISGETDRAVALLAGQLRTQDRSAWRTRAMILAMNGRNSEAIDIVKATMPPTLATSIIPYLAQMDRLTPAQQASAAHFGRFPSDEMPLRAIDKPQQMAAAASQPDTAARNRTESAAPPASATPPPPIEKQVPKPEPVMKRPAVTPLPVRVAALPTPRPGAAATGTAPSPESAAPKPVITPGFSIASVGTEAAAASRPEPAGDPVPSADQIVSAPVDASPAAVPAAAPLASLADIANSIEIPAEERVREAGALDAAALEKLLIENRRVRAAEEAQAKKEADAAREKAAAEAKEKAEAAERKANPARAWVQIATGTPVRALAFDYRKLVKKFPANFKGQSAATTDWNRTYRLLVGPFKNGKAADAWLESYKKAGGDGFTFDSEAGQSVEPLK